MQVFSCATGCLKKFPKQFFSSSLHTIVGK